jgi:hypothetical protein
MEPPPELSPGAGEVGAGDVLVVEPPLPLPPHPTASTSIAVPPSSAIVALGSDFISCLLPLAPSGSLW